MAGISEHLELFLTLIGAATAVLGWWRWLRPKLKARAAERDAINEVLLGRPAVAANPITGAPAQPERRPIGQLVADIHHELHPNNGSSMRDSVDRTEAGVAALAAELADVRARLADGDRRFHDVDARLANIETVLADELATATDTVANAAEASKTALRVIEAAIQAEPGSTTRPHDQEDTHG